MLTHMFHPEREKPERWDRRLRWLLLTVVLFSAGGFAVEIVVEMIKDNNERTKLPVDSEGARAAPPEWRGKRWISRDRATQIDPPIRTGTLIPFVSSAGGNGLRLKPLSDEHVDTIRCAVVCLDHGGDVGTLDLCRSGGNSLLLTGKLKDADQEHRLNVRLYLDE